MQDRKSTMMDRQALVEQFLDFLQTSPTPPDYLNGEPPSPMPFDPYQMVAEWIALRHEVKQQGKLLQASQSSLQKALEALQVEREAEPGRSLLSQDGNQPGIPQTDQKALWRDLLTVMDALDQASAHWQTQLDDLQVAPSSAPAPALPDWKRWLQQLIQPQPATDATDALRETLQSNQQGIDLIRRSLLDVLRQRQVFPMAAQGKPFNPQIMYAVGRQESTSLPDNTVIQEVVRGYWWGDQVLREAQVIVATRPG